MSEGKNQRAFSVPPLHETGYDRYENNLKGREPIRPKAAFLDLGLVRAQSEGIEPHVARFESKWFKNLKKAKTEAEAEDPSVPHKPPRDSTADTYIPPPIQIHAKENRTPAFYFNSKMEKIITL